MYINEYLDDLVKLQGINCIILHRLSFQHMLLSGGYELQKYYSEEDRFYCQPLYWLSGMSSHCSSAFILCLSNHLKSSISL